MFSSSVDEIRERVLNKNSNNNIVYDEKDGNRREPGTY